MSWYITDVPEDESRGPFYVHEYAVGDYGLTDGELVGFVVMLTQQLREPYDESDLLFRAWRKLMPAFEVAVRRGNVCTSTKDADEAVKDLVELSEKLGLYDPPTIELRVCGVCDLEEDCVPDRNAPGGWVGTRHLNEK